MKPSDNRKNKILEAKANGFDKVHEIVGNHPYGVYSDKDVEMLREVIESVMETSRKVFLIGSCH